MGHKSRKSAARLSGGAASEGTRVVVRSIDFNATSGLLVAVNARRWGDSGSFSWRTVSQIPSVDVYLWITCLVSWHNGFAIFE